LQLIQFLTKVKDELNNPNADWANDVDQTNSKYLKKIKKKINRTVCK
jgi:hypothetical protein